MHKHRSVTRAKLSTWRMFKIRSSSICCYRYASFWHLLTFMWRWCVHIFDRLNEYVMALPMFIDCFLISCTLTLSCNFDAVFYAFLAMHFSSPILYLWIIYESLRSPPSCSHCNAPCTTSSQQSLPMGDRTIHQLLTTKWGQDEGPGTKPLALPSAWIDEGAAASPGRTWKTGKSLLSTRDVPLPLEGMGLVTSICYRSLPK